MSILVRLLSLLGALGTLLCVVGAVGVWYAEVRIDRVRVQLFERVDQSLSEIDDRVVAVQKLAAQSKVTLEEIQQRRRSLRERRPGTAWPRDSTWKRGCNGLARACSKQI